MERQCYRYRVLRLDDEHTTLAAGDIFKFNVRVLFYSIDIGSLQHYSSSPFILCHDFFGEGRDLLRTLLSRTHFFIESLEEITENVVSTVRELFQVDRAVSSLPLESQPRVIPLMVKIFIENSSENEAMEESMQNFRMVPASNEAIRTLLRKSTVMRQSECCSICLEDLDINAECYTMPCNHVFHPQCIVTWLQTDHVCPLCRYSLPTL